MVLQVQADDFEIDEENDWASVISGKPDSFSLQIAANTDADAAKDLAPEFSGTTPVDICKQYFQYVVETRCVCSRITLEGTEVSWFITTAPEQTDCWR